MKNKIYEFLIIFLILFNFNQIHAADMTGYVLDQAMQDIEDEEYDKAFSALQNIAPAGNPLVIFILGNLYLNGLGTDKNYKHAHEMILYAAKELPKKNIELATKAQIIISSLYMNGIGTEIDNIEAYKWAHIASLKNDENAIELINLLNNSLTEAQIKTAIERANKIIKMLN